jgi:hypothetical protein
MTDVSKPARKRKAKGPFSEELLDELISQVSGQDAESLLGVSGLVGQLKKQLESNRSGGERGTPPRGPACRGILQWRGRCRCRSGSERPVTRRGPRLVVNSHRVSVSAMTNTDHCPPNPQGRRASY